MIKNFYPFCLSLGLLIATGSLAAKGMAEPRNIPEKYEQEIMKLIDHPLQIDQLNRDHNTTFQNLIPITTPILNNDTPTIILLILQQRQQGTQDLHNITLQIDLHEIAQTEHIQLNVNLYTADLTLLGQKFKIKKTRTNHQQNIALLHHPITQHRIVTGKQIGRAHV